MTGIVASQPRARAALATGKAFVALRSTGFRRRRHADHRLHLLQS